MRYGTFCSRVFLGAAALCWFSFLSKVPAADQEVAPANRNTLLLTLIERVMSDDPAFRVQLAELVGGVEADEVKSLREQLSTANETMKQLQADLARARKNGGTNGELGIQPPEPTVWVNGTLTVDNRCSYPIEVRINGQFKSIGPGRFQFPVRVDKAKESAQVELVGYESPKTWMLRAPDYTATFVVAPR